MRLDAALAQRLPEWSRTRLQRLIKQGAVRVNGATIERASHAVTEDDAIEVDAGTAPPRPAAVEAEDIPLEVVWEDADLAVINKPAGLLVHPGAGQRQGTLVSALLHRYGGLSATGGSERAGIVHRLDRSTSGVMAVARTDFAHLALGRQFQARSVGKTYVALVHGVPREREGEITLAIARDRIQRTRMTTRRPEEYARAAHTKYRVMKSSAGVPRYSRLELEILTGRTHQIRVHLAALGHAVVGDPMYGAPRVLAGPGELAGVAPERVMLHARRLELDHPRTGERMRFEAAMPEAMTTLAQRMGI